MIAGRRFLTGYQPLRLATNHVPVAQGIERLPSKQTAEAKTVNDVNNVDLLGRFIDDRKATKGLTLSGERWLKETLTKFLSWLPVPPSEVARNHVSFLARYEAMPWRKHSFYRALKTFWKWASINHSLPNPMIDRLGNLVIDAPKTPVKVLYTITPGNVKKLIDAARSNRDKAVISLLADSGARGSEVAGINCDDVDLTKCRIKVRGKGGKEGFLVFGATTKGFVSAHVQQLSPKESLFGLTFEGLKTMLQRLEKQTGIKCNAHSFRRGFATELRRKGLSELDIAELGRWSSTTMVKRYSRAYTFDDAAERYKPIVE